MFGGGSLFTGSNLEHKFTGKGAVTLKGRIYQSLSTEIDATNGGKKEKCFFRVCLPIWEVSKYLFGLSRASVSEGGGKFGEIYALFRLFAGLHQIRTLLHHKANKSR